MRMKKQRGTTKKVELEIVRENGVTEIVDVTHKTIGKLISSEHAAAENLARVRTATVSAGRGDVIRAVVTYQCSNIDQLIRDYNNLNNEGGEGYIPYEMLINSSEYKQWDETVEVR